MVMTVPYVQFPRIPAPPPGSKGGVIRPAPISFAFLAEEPQEQTTGDRWTGDPPPTPWWKQPVGPSSPGLPAEWMPRQVAPGTIEHD
jgi:hypothetical protein